MTVRRRFHGLVSIDESIYARDIRFLGIRVWRTLYWARTVEWRLFGLIRVSVKDCYPYKISVLMPARNAGQSIAAAIDSVLAQTFADFEFIIINDCSTDNTESIVRGYSDLRVMLVNNGKALGRERSLDLGFDLCRGECIALMEPGCVAPPDSFAKQMARTRRSFNPVGIPQDGPLCRTRERFRKDVLERRNPGSA